MVTKGLKGNTAQTFGTYAAVFFYYKSPWVKNRLAEGTADHPALSASYITRLQSVLRVHLIPFFSKYLLSDITPSVIRLFRTKLIQKNALSLKTVNNAADTLRIITDTAYNDGISNLIRSGESNRLYLNGRRGEPLPLMKLRKYLPRHGKLKKPD